MKYTLENDKLKAAFRTQSAELVSLVRKSDGKELVWHADPAYWGWSSPILFPFVGSVLGKEYRYQGKTYYVNQHGFARNREFVLEAKNENSIAFRLTDSPETREIYPFAFILTVSYVLKDNTLAVDWRVENPDTKEMYFSIGAHPAFMAPLADGEAQTDGYLCFPDAKSDVLSYKLIDPSVNAIAGQLYELPLTEGKAKIQPGMFDKDALIVEGSQAGMLGLAGSDGKPYVMLSFNAPLFGIWSPAGKNAPFICLEPWYGRSDAVGFTGTLEEREYEQRLEGGGVFTAGYTITVF